MKKNNNAIIIGLITLIIGLGIGYTINVGSGGERRNIQSSTHVMPNDENMSMSDMMISMNAELKGKSGDAFDQAFLAEMITHHQGAIEMAQLALTNAKHQEIKDLANGIISAQNKEIGEMKAWQKSWYNQ